MYIVYKSFLQLHIILKKFLLIIAIQKMAVPDKMHENSKSVSSSVDNPQNTGKYF